MSTIVILLFRFVLFLMFKPFNMYTQGVDKEQQEEDEREEYEEQKNNSIQKTKTEEEEAFYDVHEEQFSTSKETIDSIRSSSITKNPIQKNTRVEYQRSFSDHSLNFFNQDDSKSKNNLELQQLSFSHISHFQREVTEEGIGKKKEVGKMDQMKLYGNGETVPYGDREDREYKESRENKDRKGKEDQVDNKNMNLLYDDKPNYIERRDNGQENETKGAANDREREMNKKSLILNSLKEDVKFLNQKYNSKVRESKINDSKMVENEMVENEMVKRKKTEDGNNPLKDIYEELENPKQNRTNHFEFSNNLSDMDSNYNSKNEEEQDGQFLQKIEYTSDNDTGNNHVDDDLFSKEPFDMTASAAHIWDNINKLEVEDQKSDLESADSFSNFIKEELFSNDYEKDKGYINYSTSINLEMEQMKQKKKNMLTDSTESETNNWNEFPNNSFLENADNEKKNTILEKRGIYSSPNKNQENDITHEGNRKQIAQQLEFYEMKNTSENKNNIKNKQEDNLFQEINKFGKINSFESSPSDIHYARFSSTDDEEQEKKKTTTTHNVVLEKTDQKNEKMNMMGKVDEDHSLMKLQNWISFRKSNITHFATQPSSSPLSFDMKKVNQMEDERRREVKKNEMERDGQENEPEKKNEEEKEGFDKVENENENENKVEDADENQDNDQAEDNISTSASGKDDITSETQVSVEDIITEKKEVKTDDTIEVHVNFNDGEQWEEEERKGKENNSNKISINKQVRNQAKQRKGTKEKFDIPNEKNEKVKNERIKIMSKKNAKCEKEKGKLKKLRKEGNRKQKEENKELNTLGKELNIQILNLEKKQEKVKKLEYELIAKSAEMELEREEIKNRIEEEKKKMIKTIEEERKKWLKEKKRIEAQVEKQRNIILSRKKLSNEIALYKNKIKEVEKMLEKEKEQHKIITDRLKKQVENLTKENEKIKMELKISEEYRDKVESYQQKTILKLAKNVNDKHTPRALNYSVEKKDAKHNHVNSSESEQGKRWQRKKKEKETEKDIFYTDESSKCSESEKSESKEMKKILNQKRNENFDEFDVIYADLNSSNDGLHNIHQTEIPLKQYSNGKGNNKKRVSLNNLFVNKTVTKEEEEEEEEAKTETEAGEERKKKITNEAEIEKKVQKIRTMMMKNKKTIGTEQVSNSNRINDIFGIGYNGDAKMCEREPHNNTIQTLDPSNQIISQRNNQKKNLKNTTNLYSERISEKGTQKRELWDNSHFLDNYPYSRNVLMHSDEKKTQNYESMFENLNEKICIDKLSDQFTRKSGKDYADEHNYKDSYKKSYCNKEQIEMAKKNSVHILNTDLVNVEKQTHGRLHGFENYCDSNVSNENNQYNECNQKNMLNVFGKDWTFLLNFNFEKLFEKCENIMKSSFSLSKKIKYRQAFVDGKVETSFEDGLRIIEKNKNRKIIHPDNIVIHLFHNKDYKARLPNAYMLYHFASKGIYQVNIPDMCQLNKFPTGQIDCKYNDGHMQIMFPDGKRREILPNKEEYAFSLNGTMKKLK